MPSPSHCGPHGDTFEFREGERVVETLTSQEEAELKVIEILEGGYDHGCKYQVVIQLMKWARDQSA